MSPASPTRKGYHCAAIGAKSETVATIFGICRGTVELGLLIQEITAKYKVHPNLVSTGKRLAIAGLSEVFSNGAERALGWFTEGFDTADLKQAKTLLDELK